MSCSLGCVRKYDLLGAGDMLQTVTYPREREGVDYVVTLCVPQIVCSSCPSQARFALYGAKRATHDAILIQFLSSSKKRE